jgi:hypothetical protein
MEFTDIEIELICDVVPWVDTMDDLSEEFVLFLQTNFYWEQQLRKKQIENSIEFSDQYLEYFYQVCQEFLSLHMLLPKIEDEINTRSIPF